MSLHEIEIERMRKEKENLERELEKAELETTNAKVRRKIDYLKAPPIIFPSTDQSKPIPQYTSHSVMKTQPTMPMNTIPPLNQYARINQNNPAFSFNAAPINQIPLVHPPNQSNQVS